LTTRFCEIRFAKPAPDKAFGGIEAKKINRDPPGKPKRSHGKTRTELYFRGEIHTPNRLSNQPGQRRMAVN
jgi:hypothetical protein